MAKTGSSSLVMTQDKIMVVVVVVYLLREKARRRFEEGLGEPFTIMLLFEAAGRWVVR